MKMKLFVAHYIIDNKILYKITMTWPRDDGRSRKRGGA